MDLERSGTAYGRSWGQRTIRCSKTSPPSSPLPVRFC
jgi:hypothetical protein